MKLWGCFQNLLEQTHAMGSVEGLAGCALGTVNGVHSAFANQGAVVWFRAVVQIENAFRVCVCSWWFLVRTGRPKQVVMTRR